jgi:hypothetical protein
MRRRWGATPTDADADAVDRRLTQAVAEPRDYDTPDLEALMQSTALEDGIPVELVGPARVNQLPTRIGAMFSRLVTKPGPSVKVLPYDPRRALVYIAPNTNIQVMMGRTQAEADGPDAFIWPASFVSTAGANNPFKWVDEVWLRIWPGPGVVDGAYRISVMTEEWAR